MKLELVKELAAARGQEIILAWISGKPHWLLVDDWPCLVAVAMQSLGTSDFELWAEGKLKVFDDDVNPLAPGDQCPKIVRLRRRWPRTNPK